jgi:hypothetical protein
MRKLAFLLVLATLALAGVPESVALGEIRILHYGQDGQAAGVEQRTLDEEGRTSPDAGGTSAATGTGPSDPAAAAGHADPDDPDDPRNRFEPGEVLVVAPTPGALQRLQAQGFTVLERQSMAALAINLFRLRVPGEMSVPEAIDLLRRRFPDLTIDANHLYEPSASSEDAPASWARAVIGWNPAPQSCGRGLRLGVIDAPVDTSHPALAGQRVEYRSFHRKSRRAGPADHGTAVAAMLIGQPGPQGWGGIVPGAEVKAGNIFEYNDSGRLVGNAAALLKALDWMTKERVHVVNLSVAGADNKALRYALEQAGNRGLIMVAAAGNWGRSDRPAYPAAYEEVIAVTAFGAGGDAYEMANRGAYIDFAAPGVRVWTAVPEGGRYQSGTSFAVPYVSAQIAAEQARGPAKGPEDLRRILRCQAVDLGVPGKDEVFGWGFIGEAPRCTT